MYGKWKTTLTPQVDMEPKRQLKSELLGNLKPILEAQGKQFSNIARVMREEERRSSLTSTTVAPITIEPTSDQVLAGGVQPQGELQVAASPPLHSLEPT
jgi:hypothetical protein